jgi:hypothetical protein
MPEPDMVQWFDVEVRGDTLAVCFSCRLKIEQELEDYISVSLKEFSRDQFDPTMTLCCEICGSVIFQGEEE